MVAAGAKTVYDKSEPIPKDIVKQIFYIGSDASEVFGLEYGLYLSSFLSSKFKRLQYFWNEIEK